MNVAARKLLATLEDDKVPEGGIFGLAALRSAALDGTTASLQRLDRVLAQARAQRQPGAADDPAWAQLARFAAFYIGEHIAHQLGQDIQWYSREAALRELPPDFGLPEAPFTQVVGIVAAMVCLPLGHVLAVLEGDVAPSSADYVASFLARTRDNSRDENAWAALYLRSLEDGSYVPGGVALRERLAGLGLDYSLQSLERVDAFLAWVRATQQPAYGPYVTAPATSNLLLMLAYYLASTVARSGGIALKWLTDPEIRAHIPELEARFETARGAALDGRLFFPLQPITAMLFADDPQHGCARFAQRVLGEQPRSQVVTLHRPEPGAPRPAVEIPPEWSRVFRQAGLAAAYHMYMVAGGSSFIPTLTQPQADGAALNVTLLYDDGNQAVEEGMARLAQGTHLPWMLFTYDSYANLPQGRVDALCMEVRCHGHWPLSLTLALPYRPASAESPFALQDPRIVACSAAPFAADALAQAFHAAADEFQVADFSWRRSRDASL